MVNQLEYASYQTIRTERRYFKTWLAVFAVCGFAFNLSQIYVLTSSIHESIWVAHDLRQNNKAISREVPAVVIAELQKPYTLWISASAYFLAVSFGLLLSVDLLCSTWQFKKSRELGWKRLDQYRFWKRIGNVATTFSFFWFFSELQNFWYRAAWHHPVGSGPPFLETAILACASFVPLFWIGKKTTVIK